MSNYRPDIKIETWELPYKETFYFSDLYDLRDDSTPHSVEEVKPKNYTNIDGSWRFFRLFDADGDIIDKVAINDDEIRKIELKSYGSNFEAFLLEYDFFKKDFVSTASLNFVKSDYNDCLKEDAVVSVEDKIYDYWGVLELDKDFLYTFFDNLPTDDESNEGE